MCIAEGKGFCGKQTEYEIVALTLLVADAQVRAGLGGDGIEQAAVPQLHCKVQGGAAVAVCQANSRPRRQQRLDRRATPAPHRQVQSCQALQCGRIHIASRLRATRRSDLITSALWHAQR